MKRRRNTARASNVCVLFSAATRPTRAVDYALQFDFIAVGSVCVAWTAVDCSGLCWPVMDALRVDWACQDLSVVDWSGLECNSSPLDWIALGWAAPVWSQL